MEKEKWFIVFYVAIRLHTDLPSYGNISFSVVGGDPFLNRLDTIEHIKSLHKDFFQVAITNFIQVSKHEYEIWNKKDNL